MLDLKTAIENNLQLIKELRIKLHENAELSHEEHKTQKIIQDFFNSIGINTDTFAKTGIAAVINNAPECVGLRADMDALPVNGVSHVCGHDYHMAIACGVALVLKELSYDKCVKFIFQPAEEADGGALPMINEGVLENPKVKNMLGFHVWPGVQAGTIEVSSGASMASVDDFHITFKGKGGHAAMPHLCRNPLYPAMDLIQTMNLKAKIEINPLDSHVITFSSLQCGNAPNIIADECIVKGTVRTFNNDLRYAINKDIINSSNLCAEKYDCSAEIKYNFEYPPVVSDEAFTRSFINITKALIGDRNVLPLERTFAAEDFSFFAEKVPSVHFRLGIAEGSIGQSPLHSPSFDASQDTLFNGINIITNFILSIQ